MKLTTEHAIWAVFALTVLALVFSIIAVSLSAAGMHCR